MTSKDDVTKLHKFLKKAADDDDAERKKYLGKPSNDPVVVEVDAAFEKEKRDHGFPPDKPWEPSKELCRELAEFTKWLDEHGHAPAASPPFDQIYVVVRFAMPLVATAESDGGATG